MFSLGTGSESFSCLIHTPDFDLDERSLPVGAAVLAETALRFLKKRSLSLREELIKLIAICLYLHACAGCETLPTAAQNGLV